MQLRTNILHHRLSQSESSASSQDFLVAILEFYSCIVLHGKKDLMLQMKLKLLNQPKIQKQF